MAASLAALLPYFPPVDFAMGYGSAVFQQSGHNDSTSMIDLVLAVEDPLAWHTEQLQRHPEHYSGIKHLGPEAIVYVQENFGAGCYYNTLVPVPGSSQLSTFPPCVQRHPTFSCLVKYGVVKTSTLCHELTEWPTLYLSGRMHKPSRLKVTQTPHGKKLLKFAVSAVVGQYSRTQSLKGIATAGGIKTLVYVWQKLSRTYLGK
ncbi:hypothetical protein DYB31_011472 [Aphanomyces astaci]|uniref:Phosphatidate cytidylyltransferase, mitochondrial n=1 Tax=Aphanomyces astaci TaxID=112090 RepID=A0A397FF07_APHAT|nr:hypothetical protein DYB31_011472 [Aphanomyces astaci]